MKTQVIARKGYYSWRVDPELIRGNLESKLPERRHARAAQRVFCTTLTARHPTLPRVVHVDQQAAYPQAMCQLKRTRSLPKGGQLRQNKYMNNINEPDHRCIKRLVNLGLGFTACKPAARTLAGDEPMPMLRKGQIQGAPKGDIQRQVRFIEHVFEIGA